MLNLKKKNPCPVLFLKDTLNLLDVVLTQTVCLVINIKKSEAILYICVIRQHSIPSLSLLSLS